MTGEVIIQLPGSCLYTDMTGEVIIQIPRYCLYWHMTEVIIQLPDYVSILTYDRRSHHPATQILSLTDIWLEKSSSRYCLYADIWLEKSSSSYPIMSLCWHMTGELIVQQLRSCLYWHMTGEVIIQLPRSCLYWHMTGEVIIQLTRYCLYAVILQEKSSFSYPNTLSMLSYDRRSHPVTRSCLYSVIWQ